MRLRSGEWPQRLGSPVHVYRVRGYLPVVCIAGLLLALAPGLRAQSFGFPWWRDAQFQRELVLTADQSARIEGVYQTAIPSLRQKKEELDQQEEELSRLIANNADELVVTKQVDKVEAIRASLNKMRTLMLLHMRQVLMPDQRARLNKLHEQWLKDHARPKNEK
jgi:Spy/CpxP family protein refolding chaperone